MPLRILILEDRPTDAELMLREVRKEGIESIALRVETESDFRKQLREFRPGLILADYCLPAYDGLSALAVTQKECPDVPFILVSGTLGEEQAIDALHHGAADYVLKQRLARLGPSVRRALHEAEEHRNRTQAEAALAKSEQKYRRLFETSRDAIMTLFPPNWKFTSANPATVALFGARDEQEFTSLGLWEVSPERQPDGELSSLKAQRMIATAMEQGSHLFDWTHQRINGEPFPATVLLTCVELEGAMGLQATVRDITERKQMEEANARLAMAVEQAAEAIVITDAAGTILYVNPAFEHISGYPQQEAIGQNPRILKSGKQDAAFYQRMWAVLESGQVWQGRFINKRKDGLLYEEEATISAIRNAAGQILNYVAVKRDITERLRNERLALRSQRLEAIGALAGGVAHDLNNALAPIMMGVELLRMDFPGQSRILDTFQISAQRAADMVRQLLSFARGAEGERVTVQPCHLIKELHYIVKGTFPKNILLEVKCEPQLPTLLGDATQLHQVLLNLCVNARDAMPGGGTLTLEAQRVAVDAVFASSLPDAKPGDYVMLRVRDTGTGIPPEILDRVFEPFFTTKGLNKGTGLGLSNVMGIVKGHGGFVQVESKVGQGSTFAAYLPAGDAEGNTASADKAELEFRGQGETILFVDDEGIVRDTVRAVLRRLNFQVVTAIDGADGLIHAVEHRDDLRAIITDLHMPHMDGLNFVRALRRILPDIPVVVASGLMEEAVASELRTLGVTSRLDKPFTESQLAAVLQSIFAPE
jgi:PAS domain S-box-containing protein